MLAASIEFGMLSFGTGDKAATTETGLVAESGGNESPVDETKLGIPASSAVLPAPSISKPASIDSLERRQSEQHDELLDDVHHDLSAPCPLKSKQFFVMLSSSKRSAKPLLFDAAMFG